MKSTCFLFTWLTALIAVSCSTRNVSVEDDYIQARVMYTSCGGTVLQFIDSTKTHGKDWLWFKNLNGPFDASNAAQVYPRCVTAFVIPKERQILGDTLRFTYETISNPPGSVCTIGGLPMTYVSIKRLL